MTHPNNAMATYPVTAAIFETLRLAHDPETDRAHYRALVVGEDTIQLGDEVWEFSIGPWGPVSSCEHGQQYRLGYNKMRRRITPA